LRLLQRYLLLRQLLFHLLLVLHQRRILVRQLLELRLHGLHLLLQDLDLLLLRLLVLRIRRMSCRSSPQSTG
jgi:hypothetical protein